MDRPDVRTIDVGRVLRRYLLLGALVPAALGIIGVLTGGLGLGLSDPGAGTRVGLGVIGGFFLLIAGAVFYLLAAHPPQAFLDVGRDELALRDGKAGWTRTWDEITDLALVHTRTTSDTHTTSRGSAVLLTLPRWFLRVRARGHGVEFVDLGHVGGVLHEVQDALGARVRVDQSRPRPPST